MQAEHLDPIALHRKNNEMLSSDDILIPAYPGSGQAFLGNVLLELGLNYSDPYTERFEQFGSSQPLEARSTYRRRLAATAASDAAGLRRVSRRFVKTHLYPDHFQIPPNGIVLLVRDPRDAIYSYYRWRLGFSEEGENGSFENFLDRVGPQGLRPCQDWTQFYLSWLAKRCEVSQFIVLRFEDLKCVQGNALEPLLKVFTPDVERSRVPLAFQASSFAVMRTHEDQVAIGTSDARIMRLGKVGEWRQWFQGALKLPFDDPLLQNTASMFDYSEWPSRD